MPKESQKDGILHRERVRHNLTTYEYIIEKKQLKKAQEKNKKVSKSKKGKILPFSTGKASKDMEAQSQKPSSVAEIDDHHTSDRHSIPELMRRSGKSHTNRTGLSDANLTVERGDTKYFTKVFETYRISF